MSIISQNNTKSQETESAISRFINSTRKYDDMGDWLYLKLMLFNIGTFIKAALGDRSGLDKMLDKLFYDYNG
ncbi:MAG: hypothetical protein IK990_04895 [Ruminiclostridium sp.]|nr:hypothetical protein [Ruminiclostridium sp.]